MPPGTGADHGRHIALSESGVETQWQWNEKAIARTTPTLLGLFSLVRLLADRPHRQRSLSVQRKLWSDGLFCMSSAKADIEIIQEALLERFADALCYAA